MMMKVIIIIIILFIYFLFIYLFFIYLFTAIGLSPGGSGYFTCIQKYEFGYY